MEKNNEIMDKVLALVKELELAKNYNDAEDYYGNLMKLPDYGKVIAGFPERAQVIYTMSWLSAQLFK